jgi:hypothetical protein
MDISEEFRRVRPNRKPHVVHKYNHPNGHAAQAIELWDPPREVGRRARIGTSSISDLSLLLLDMPRDFYDAGHASTLVTSENPALKCNSSSNALRAF